MKNIIILVLFIVASIDVLGQNLPTLDLREKISSEAEFSKFIKTNEIGVVIKISCFWFPFDNTSYIIFKNDGNIIAYDKKSTKSYPRGKNKVKETLTKTELNTEQKEKFTKALNSPKMLDFLKYSQKDFKKSNPNPFQMCIISDSIKYNFTFVQNGKENSYEYYAPDYYLEKCDDDSINKIVLGKFIDIRNLWIEMQ